MVISNHKDMKLTPETCKHQDLLCTECPDKLSCEPLALELQSPVFGGRVDPRPRPLPAFLKGASKSVRASYGY